MMVWELKRIVENREYWSKYFNVVPFSVVPERNIIKEKIVEKKTFSTEDALVSIFRKYEKYFEEYEELSDYSKKKKIYAKEDINRFCILFGIERLHDDIRTLMDDMPSVITHGDLWASNILFDGEQYYICDFEALDYRIFYYDIFLCIFSEAYIMKKEI